MLSQDEFESIIGTRSNVKEGETFTVLYSAVGPSGPWDIFLGPFSAVSPMSFNVDDNQGDWFQVVTHGNNTETVGNSLSNVRQAGPP